MSKRTYRGYSLAETLISLSLLSLLILVYCNLSAFYYSQYNKSVLTSRLFSEAHSIARILEDKNTNEIPETLFSISNSTPIALIATTNHTIEMSLEDLGSFFQITIPNELANTHHTVICTISSLSFGNLQSMQLRVFVMTRLDQKILYGYASCVL